MKYLKILALVHSILFFISISAPAKESKQMIPLGYFPDDPLPEKTVYLTFDDGPSEWTDGILDILQQDKIKATFFICAEWASKSNATDNDFKKFSGSIVRMINEGHVIGNHTVDHKNLAKLTAAQIIDELKENQRLLDEQLGKKSPYMSIIRPPFGSPWLQNYSAYARPKVTQALGSNYIVAMWSRHFDSSDSMEWVRGEWFEQSPRVYEGSADFKEKMHRIYRRVLSRANGQGIVILFHDTHLTTKDILPSIIDELKKRGYSFATMEDFVRWKYGKSSKELIGLNRE